MRALWVKRMLAESNEGRERSMEGGKRGREEEKQREQGRVGNKDIKREKKQELKEE